MKLGYPLVDEIPRHEKPFVVPVMDGCCAACRPSMLLVYAGLSFGEKQYPLAVGGF
jgi:hypothetical protein